MDVQDFINKTAIVLFIMDMVLYLYLAIIGTSLPYIKPVLSQLNTMQTQVSAAIQLFTVATNYQLIQGGGLVAVLNWIVNLFALIGAGINFAIVIVRSIFFLMLTVIPEMINISFGGFGLILSDIYFFSTIVISVSTIVTIKSVFFSREHK